MVSSPALERSRTILSFLRNYGNLTEMQLQAVRDDMQAAVSRLLSAVESINATSESQKTAAEADYERAHLNPDAASEEAMLAAQSAVDSLIDSLLESGDDQTANQPGVSRTGSKFSKSVEAISGLHTGLAEPLMNIMGVLSIEDVVGQRLSHVISTTNHFSEELAGLLATLKHPFSVETVDAFASDLLRFSLQQYTIREEKILFNKIFPRDYQKDLAARCAKDVQAVVKLLGFTEAFTQLLGSQLQAVSSAISDTVATAMASVFAIGSVSEAGKKHADTMLVKGGGAGAEGFIQASIKEAEGTSQTSGGEAALLDNASEILTSIDNELNSRILQMMGDLSIEDVVGQRLEHIITSFNDLLAFTNDVVNQLSHSGGAAPVESNINAFLQKLYSSYTMEAEKRCFRTVFGSVDRIKASA